MALRDVAMELVWAALGAVNPARAVARHLRWEPPTLFVGDRPYDLTGVGRVVVIGAGKAGAGMAAAVEALLGDRIAAGNDGRLDAVLTKPITRLELQRAIAEAVARRRRLDPAVAAAGAP